MGSLKVFTIIQFLKLAEHSQNITAQSKMSYNGDATNSVECECIQSLRIHTFKTYAQIGNCHVHVRPTQMPQHSLNT